MESVTYPLNPQPCPPPGSQEERDQVKRSGEEVLLQRGVHLGQRDRHLSAVRGRQQEPGEPDQGGQGGDDRGGGEAA